MTNQQEDCHINHHPPSNSATDCQARHESRKTNVGISSFFSRRRRNLITTSTAVLSSLLVGVVSDDATNSYYRSNAFPFGNDSNVDRRQKELCLVNLLRLLYWSETIVYTLDSSSSSSEDDDLVAIEEQRKKAYLEARLGSKAMVGKKQNRVGGGATPRVFLLISLGITGCLEDLVFYAKDKKRIEQIKEDIIEGLASIVEFDGLETTQDPSPRSSLTMGQYNDQKAIFVKRMLSERISPLIEELVNYFGSETRTQCEAYIREYYTSELPPTTTVVRTTTVQGLSQNATTTDVDQV